MEAQIKKCIICGETSPIKWYSGPKCRKCYSKIYYETHRIALLNRQNSKEVSSRRKSTGIDYYKRNKVHISQKAKYWWENRTEAQIEEIRVQRRDYKRNRAKVDDIFKLTCNLRSRLYSALKGLSKHKPTLTLLGCSIKELKDHLESQFQLGMSWNNHAKFGWHVDHVIPLCSFDLSDPKQLEKACHFSNLQPLWWHDNISKGGKNGNIRKTCALRNLVHVSHDFSSDF